MKTYTPAGGNLSAGKIRWTSDGKAFAYATENTELVANIWLQNLDDSAPAQLTDYNAERIFDFGWSPDRKQLAVIRGSWSHEAVLISSF